MRASSRGMTLVEAMVAAGVLAVGTAALMNLLSSISVANRQASFHASALEVVAKFTAEISDATCDVLPVGPAVRDPGLLPGMYIDPATSGSLTLVGDRTELQPPMRVQYTVTDGPAPVNPNLTPPTLEVQLEICDYQNVGPADCVLGAAFAASVHTKLFTINKVCNIRTDADGRGEYFY